jgi:hypothetical protein
VTVVILPHTTYHNIRSPLLRTLGRVDGIIVLVEKDVLDYADFAEVYRRAREVVEGLRGEGIREVAIVLTGSYLACVLAYKAFAEQGFDVILLQWDSRSKSYIVFRTRDLTPVEVRREGDSHVPNPNK